MQYVAFLRGINSGKNPMLKMDVLRMAFESMGFANVQTVIASGNVLFESEEKDVGKLETKIGAILPDMIGFESAVVVIAKEELQALVEKDPFANLSLSDDNRPHVTLFKVSPKDATFFESQRSSGIKFVELFGRIVCYVIERNALKTPQAMGSLEKEYGKSITTRTWRTIERIVKK